MSSEAVVVVYECPGCEERLVQRRCPDCNVFCRRLGVGGCCPGYGEIVLAAKQEAGL